MSEPSETRQRDFEAAAFRRLLEHLRTRSDVQNIDLMNLAGFCRNCLANWYRDAAAAGGVELSKDDARAIVYGMHQTPAGDEQQAAFERNRPRDH
jgi:uncharacterized protein